MGAQRQEGGTAGTRASLGGSCSPQQPSEHRVFEGRSQEQLTTQAALLADDAEARKPQGSRCPWPL